MIKKFMVVGALAAAVLLVGPPKASAQAPNGFVVDHFGPANQVYSIVNYCNLPGTPGCSEFDGAAYTCANIYVYHDEDIVACGSCFISPNGSLEEDLNRDLLGSALRPVITPPETARSGVVKFVTTQFTANFCDPTSLGATAASNAYFRDRNGLDIELSGVNLSAAEEARLNRDCTAVNIILSGGFNVSCGPSDPPKGVRVHNALKKTRPGG